MIVHSVCFSVFYLWGNAGTIRDLNVCVWYIYLIERERDVPLLSEGRKSTAVGGGEMLSWQFSYIFSLGALGNWSHWEEQGNEEDEGWSNVWGSSRLYFLLCNKDDLAGLIDLGLLQISSALQAAGGNYWQCLQVTVIKPQLIIILFLFFFLIKKISRKC